MAYPLPAGTRSHMTTAMMKDYQLRRGREGPSTAAKGMICLALVQSLTSLIVIAFGIYRLLLSCNNGNLGTGAWVGGVITASGILGIVAGLSREEKPLSSFLVTSLLAVLLSVVLIVMEGLGLSSEIQNCTLTSVTCQPGCLIGSTVLVLLGLFHLCLGASLALLSARITRKNVTTDNMIMPLWAMPTSSDYYGDFYMNNPPARTTNQKRIAQQDLQVAIQEHDEDHELPEVSSFSSKKHTDDDRFVFP